MSTELNRFERAIGIRTRPNVRIGDVVLLSKRAPSWVKKQYGNRSKWIIIRSARASRYKPNNDGLYYYWIRNMKTSEEIMIARRDIWKTGWNVRKVSQ